MADAAQWLEAAEHSAGLPEGTFAKALKRVQNERMADRINNEPIVVALRKVLQYEPFDGTVGQLLETLKEKAIGYSRYFPETALKLSKDMDRLKTGMAVAGLYFERGQRGKDGRATRVWVDGQEGSTPQRIHPPVDY